ncbi:hypothetical protein HanRHA438_Chr09g0385811 [Helianthus annuus]|nr:hypothetical protein HanRHA438_Chr09g0385811 [Helianthus annuus]
MITSFTPHFRIHICCDLNKVKVHRHNPFKKKKTLFNYMYVSSKTLPTASPVSSQTGAVPLIRLELRLPNLSP